MMMRKDFATGVFLLYEHIFFRRHALAVRLLPIDKRNREVQLNCEMMPIAEKRVPAICYQHDVALRDQLLTRKI